MKNKDTKGRARQRGEGKGGRKAKVYVSRPQVWDQVFMEELHVLEGNGRCPRNTSTNENESEREKEREPESQRGRETEKAKEGHNQVELQIVIRGAL